MSEIITTKQSEPKNITTFLNRGFKIDDFYIRENGRIIFILTKEIKGEKKTDELKEITKEIMNGKNKECNLLSIYEDVLKQIRNISRNNKK